MKRMSRLPNKSSPSNKERKSNQGLKKALKQYQSCAYRAARQTCEALYYSDASNVDNLVLLAAIHFQLKNLSESMFYSQQCLRVDPFCAEAHSTMGNCLRELGNICPAIDFFHKAIRIQPRYPDAYNNLAMAQLLRGDILEATESFQIATSLDPSHSDALVNIGNVYKATGRHDDAKKKYLDAIRLNPSKCAIAWSNLAGVFHDCQDFKRAVESYRQAIKLAPCGFADAFSNLGNSLRQQGMMKNEANAHSDAKMSYLKALEFRNDFALAHGNLALCLLDEGADHLATKELRTGIFIEPKHTDALSNLGGLYNICGRQDDCAKVCLRAIRTKPDHPAAYENIGNALREKGQLKDALHCFAVSAKLRNHTRSLTENNLGAVLAELGRTTEAAKQLRAAIKLDPMCVEAYINLGNVYLASGKTDYAMKCYKTAMDTVPDHPKGLINLAALNFVSSDLDSASENILDAQKDPCPPNEAIVYAVFLGAWACQWSKRLEDFARVKSTVEKTAASKGSRAAAVVQPFLANIIPNLSPEISLELARAHAHRAKLRAVAAVKDQAVFRHEPGQILRGGRIKVGYVSHSFGNHPTGILTQGIYESHDRDRFEIHCYSLCPNDGSSVWKKVEEAADHFVDISHLDISKAAKLIHDDGLHFLVNLDGYTEGARNEIFALKPAPIQIAMMGHCGTMGADSIDYFVSNEDIVPPTHRDHFTERMLSIPHVPNDYRNTAAFVEDDNFDSFELRSQYGISEDAFVYACFNTPHKIDPDAFAVWMNVLKEVDESVMLFVRYNSRMEANLKEEARSRDVDPERLVFLDMVPNEEHVRRCCMVDLFLDTKVCSSMASGCEALWTATPLISVVGDRACNRVGASLLQSVSLGELVVDNLEEYQRLAILLHLDQDRYIDIIRQLEDSRKTCDLFNGGLWVSQFELALEHAFLRYEDGLKPDHIVVKEHKIMEPPNIV